MYLLYLHDRQSSTVIDTYIDTCILIRVCTLFMSSLLFRSFLLIVSHIQVPMLLSLAIQKLDYLEALRYTFVVICVYVWHFWTILLDIYSGNTFWC